jgi:hypothetical protein
MGETSNPCIPNPSHRIVVQFKGFGDQRKTRLHRCKAGLGCSWIAYRVFVGFLLVLEGEAVELSASFKRHDDLVDSVAFCPSPKVVSLLDREADLHALNFVILGQATAISQKL